MLTTAREIMTSDVAYLDEADSVLMAAELMAQQDVGSIPVCAQGRLVGMVTDRDIVVKVLAQGQDASSLRPGDLTQGEVVTVGGDDSLDEVVRVMAEHQVRRLPVIDGNRLVGIVSQGDVAQKAADSETGEMVERISQ